MKNKKSQLKIQQMALMLLAVVIFFSLIGIVFLLFRVNSLVEEKNFIERNRAILLAEFLADSPEFTCGNEYYCIDTDRLISFDTRPYAGFWPVAKIKIVKITKDPKEILCTISNYPDCNTYNFYDLKKDSLESRSSFVALCRWEKTPVLTRRCDLGKLIVYFEVKQLQ